MTIFSTVLLLLAGLLFFKCRQTKCDASNLFTIVTTLLKRIFAYLFDIFAYAIKRFAQIDWMTDEK